MNRESVAVAMFLLLSLVGCTSSSPTLADAAVPEGDGRAVDAPTTPDASSLDAGALDARADASSCGVEVGAPGDAALGGASPASRQIEAVIRAPVGPANLPLTAVTVTYVKPPDTGDVPGFMVQADRGGPALFVPTAALAAPVAV